jgi:methionyl aminopeptidase
MSILIKSPAEIEKMRAGGRILAKVLEVLRRAAQPGARPTELAKLANDEIEKRGARSAIMGHEGFPAPICISVNEVVVHGIPNAEPLAEGDIVGFDLVISYQGMMTDAAITVPVGKIDQRAQHLLTITERALQIGIGEARPGNRVGDISSAIEKALERGRLGVVKELVGHGVGRQMWEEPHVPNYGRAHTGPRLQAGMTLAIEPMATLGRDAITIDALDGWTIRSADGSLAAQFEHTVLVTDGDPEILTAG